MLSAQALLFPPSADVSVRWHRAQSLVFIAAVGVALLLVLRPEWGLNLIWNLWVPLLPGLLVLSAGTWRNLCPLAVLATSSAGRRASAPRPSPRQQELRHGLGIASLLGLIPLRHLVFDRHAIPSLLLLTGIGSAAWLLGRRGRGKSAWCAGLCPVRGLELLYGRRPIGAVPHLHCRPCTGCVSPCADLLAVEKLDGKRRSRGLGRPDRLLLATFPGFILGWFQVPDVRVDAQITHVLSVFAAPIVGAGLSGCAYLGFARTSGQGRIILLDRVFATLAVCTYYWFRIPSLVGLGQSPGDGTLIDLSSLLPASTSSLLRIASTGFFAWWLLGRRTRPSAWTTPSRSKTSAAKANDRPPRAPASRARAAHALVLEKSHASHA